MQRSRSKRGVQEALSKPDVDPQQRAAFMPNMAWDKPRFFRILGTIKTGLPGTLVNMVPRRTATGQPSATLQVVVVDYQIPFALAKKFRESLAKRRIA